MKNYYCVIALFNSIFFSYFSIPVLSQGIERGEFMIVNKSNLYTVRIKVFPVGAIFNSAKQYSPRIRGAPLLPPYQANIHITGIEDTLETFAPDFAVRGQFDGQGGTQGCKFAIGYGLYKIEFWKPDDSGKYTQLIDTCLMDWRDDNIGRYPSSFGTPDIVFNFYGDSTKFYYLSGGTEVRIDRNDVNKHVEFWKLLGTSFIYEPWYPLTPSKGLFTSDNSNSLYLNYPIDCRDFGAPDHASIEDIEMNLKLDNSYTFNITTKSNQSLSFKNGATLVARNVSFNTTSSGTSWNGIKLENSGSDTVINCTFNNAKTSLSISNNSLANAPTKIIRKNTFNINQYNGKGLDVRNLNKILIDSNIFNITNSNNTVGLFFRNADNPAAAAQSNFYYNLNIVNNKFYNGYLPILISCLTSNRTPFYIYNNQFTGDNSYSIAGVKISGQIKKNSFDLNNYNRCVGLWNSNPDLFSNNFSSLSSNIYLNYSFPSLAPTANSINQLIWNGGKNSFYSELNENINLDGSYPYLDRGQNTFTTNYNKHLLGRMPDTVNLYRMTYNCWNGYNDIPNYFLFKIVNDVAHTIAANYTPTYCIPGLNVTSQIISNKGSGIFDTTFISNNISSDTPGEQAKK